MSSGEVCPKTAKNNLSNAIIGVIGTKKFLRMKENVKLEYYTLQQGNELNRIRSEGSTFIGFWENIYERYLDLLSVLCLRR
jgi:hypothetical protein